MSLTGADGAGGAVVLPVLYSFRRCPFAMRARLAIAASGQPCELREVVLRNKPAALIAASPKATVPVLVLPDGTVLEQSLDIMRWVLARNDPARWLPQSAAEASQTDALIVRCDGEFKQHLDRYKYPNRYLKAAAGAPADAELVAFAAEHRAAGAAFVATLDAILADADRITQPAPAAPDVMPGPGLLGGRWSFADAAILPFIRQFAATDAAWFDAQPWPAVHRWLGAFVASARFAAVMDRYPPWQDGTAGVAFPN